MDRDANIDEINRELAWLRARYRLYAWAAAIAAALGSFFPVAALLVFLRMSGEKEIRDGN